MKIVRILSAVLLLVTLTLVGGLGQPASASPQPDKGRQPSDTVQHFQDIAVGSFFYNFTSLLYNEGIASGYTCGAPPAGTCVPPNNLNYYIPSNNVSRGEMSIYIGKTISPGVYVTGSYTGTTGRRGAFNATNTNYNSGFNAGLYGVGPRGVEGVAATDGSSDSYGGFFNNPITNTTNSNYGSASVAANGWGAYGKSNGHTSGQLSIGVFGLSSDYSSVFNAGVYGEGPRGVEGMAASNGSTNTSAGFFDNPITGTVNSNYGIYSVAANGYGVYARSNGHTSGQESIAVVGRSTEAGGIGGVFTGTNSTGVVGASGLGAGSPSVYGDGVDGLSGAIAGNGVYGHATGSAGAYGVWGTVEGATNVAIGGVFDSYDLGTTHLGLQVRGQGHATGGFSTGLGYSMMVKYDGDAPLQRGDVLALDGNNQTVAGNDVFGTVKAETKNANAAIGVAQYRYSVLDGGAGKPPTTQIDDQATTFQPGDLIEVVVLGRAQVKVNGTVAIGDSLSIGASSKAASGEAVTYGKVASLPDANGYVTIFVNLK